MGSIKGQDETTRGIAQEVPQVVESHCVAVDERFMAEPERLQRVLDEQNANGWSLTIRVGTILVFERPTAEAWATGAMYRDMNRTAGVDS